MSDNVIFGLMCKSGPWNRYSRRLHSLSREAKQIALDAIRTGVDPDKAIRQAKQKSK